MGGGGGGGTECPRSITLKLLMKTKFGGGSRESYRALKFVAFQRVNLFAERAQKARASTRGERGHAVPENF